MYFCIKGARINKPHIPYITLGIAARRSTAYPRHVLIFSGASTIKRDAVKARGNAINNAMAVVTSVPTMDGKAPKFSDAGSHALDVMNSKPNLFQASLLAHIS